MAEEKDNVIELNEKEFRELHRGQKISLGLDDEHGHPVYVQLNEDSRKLANEILASARRLFMKK